MYKWQMAEIAERAVKDLIPYAPSTFTTGEYIGILGDFSFYRIVDALDAGIQ